MFTLIRVLDVVEKCFNFEKIDEKKYRELVDKYLIKYDRFKGIMKGFELNKFVEVIYKIEYIFKEYGL